METVNLEYKSEITDLKKQIIRPIIAFANTSGGKIIVGYDDDGNFYKSQPKNTEERISNSIRDNILSNSELWKININRNSDGSLEIKVPESSITWKSTSIECYERQGTTTRKVACETIDTRKNEVKTNGQVYSSSNFTLLAKISKAKFDEQRFRCAYKITDENDNITNLATYVQDSSKNILVDSKKYNVLEVDKVFTLFEPLLNASFIIGQGQKANLLVQDPKVKVVIREILDNAIAHNKYPYQDIEIEYNDYAIVISNALSTNSKFEEMIRSNKINHMSEYVHRIRLFKELGLIESESQGYNDEILRSLDYEILFCFKNNRVYIMILFKTKLEAQFGNVNIKGWIKQDIFVGLVKNINSARHFFTKQGSNFSLEGEIIILGGKREQKQQL